MKTATKHLSTVLTLTAATSGLAHAATWNSSNGNWGVAGNWLNPANVPDTTGETAVINGGTATIGVDYSIGNLTVAGGAIAGAHTVTATGLTWTGGQLINDLTTVTGAATLTGPSNNNLILNDSVLYLTGATTQTGTGTYAVQCLSGGQLLNGGTYSIADDSDILASGTNSIVANYGTFRKSGGTGTSYVYGMANSGTLSAQSGTFDVSMLSGETSNGGVFNAASGATLRLGSNGTHTLATNCTLTGAGDIRFSSGVFTTTGSSSVTSTGTNVTLSGAVLDGRFVFSNLTWGIGSGSIGSAAVVSVTTATNIVGRDTAWTVIDGGTLNLLGTTQLTATNSAYGLRVDNNATVNNSSTFQLTTDAGIGIGLGTTNVFNNLYSGTLVKTGGTGTSEVYAVVNSGTLNAQSGTMLVNLKSATNAAGNYYASSGGTLRLNTPGSVNLAFGASTVFGGTGKVQFIDDSANISGTVQTNGLTMDVGTNKFVYVSGTVANGPGLLGALGFTKTGQGDLRFGGTATHTGRITIAGGRFETYDNASGQILTNAGGINLDAPGVEWYLTYGNTPANDRYAQVGNLLASGYASNFASGQIRSSVTGVKYALGYGHIGLATLVKVVIAGDANLDGTVDFNDFLTLQNNFGLSNTRWTGADFNYNGKTDFNDFLVLQNHFGQSLSGAAVAVSAEEVAAMNAFAANHEVPEPAFAAVAGLTVLAGMRRRKAV